MEKQEVVYNLQVGYLNECEVKCMECSRENRGAKLYWVNVYPYKQSCHKCGKVMVDPQDEKYGELFPDLRIE